MNRNFMWNNKKHGNTRGKVSWKKVGRPKILEGLGIRELPLLTQLTPLDTCGDCLFSPKPFGVNCIRVIIFLIQMFS